ncbi:hemolysin III [Suicoccus acidiformans]|uniref:Hemolysin III n=1 Tax=Suicoccus acidiformans TaxID=2036206 RepID=A0A347WKH3_9LACT|nr:hemolysin III family protein [Suicoccus acidiformans]AXY25580.1 hemolysin III [Suicoccus acidiformans]
MTQAIDNKRAEFWNAVTHGCAALLSVLALIALTRKGLAQASTSAILAYTVYGASMIMLFTTSSLYHSFKHTAYRNILQKIDHSSIYLLIAGTYTPYLVVAVGGRLGYIFLALVWLLASIGIYFELRYTNRFPRLSTFLYLGLGWISLFLIRPLFQTVDLAGILLLVAGGLTYSVGTVFYSQKHKPWMHVIWHVFVGLAAAFMFLSIYWYV